MDTGGGGERSASRQTPLATPGRLPLIHRSGTMRAFTFFLRGSHGGRAHCLGSESPHGSDNELDPRARFPPLSVFSLLLVFFFVFFFSLPAPKGHTQR